jgi:TRAP-type C4-dicarboxylate transport system permease small subunit
MLLRVTGTILLALGFLMLWGAWAITDPFGGDANIGAGGLIFLGRPAGTIGLVLLVIDAILQFRKRRTSGRSSA